MKSSVLREKFLAFFKARGHAVFPSDSLVPAHDPTLLFTGAGMNQFKDYFLGLKHDMKRAASVQKCFRTGDVEEVGKTPAHLTFFEMLGNFSFGDYFKPEAIRFALDFLTVELGIPLDRIWVSVYEKDEEAYRLWTNTFKFPPEKIKRFGAKDNFWPSDAPTKGPDGPCGPCSEIYYDYERCLLGKTCPDPEHCAPGCPCGRFVEVWNLVFTQYERQPDGRLKDLPSKNIDTGMGLERLTAVMQNKMSVFETDLFEPIIEPIVHLLRREAPQTLEPDQRGPVYAIADHVRALTFLIGDGVVPSNDGRGYVARMLLRRAMRHGMSLGLKEPFLYQMVPAVTAVMEGGYPELVKRRESIAKVILTEEERFLENLRLKLPLLEEEIRKHPKDFPAGPAAWFYDTHGIGYEEIVEVCAKVGRSAASKEAFEKALLALQEKSKAASSFTGAIFTKDAFQEAVAHSKLATAFVGYKELEAAARVIGLFSKDRAAQEKEVRSPAEVGLILDKSPFYGEGGGQVGDQGEIQAPEGRLKVLDTQWVGNALVHRAQILEGKIGKGDSVKAVVDPERRKAVAKNHTATHLLHAALRKVLGDHVAQAGSLVAPDRIRFDFSHAMALTSAQRKSVEAVVNEWVEAALPVAAHEVPFEEARRQGALALFGEKYGSTVRVVSIGGISKELCGGTHGSTSHDIGLFTLIEEGSVAAGVRRVEAFTGQGAFSHLKSELEKSKEEAQLTIERLTKQVKVFEEELKRFKVKDAHEQVQKLTQETIGPFSLFAEKFEKKMDPALLRFSADAIRKTEPEAIVFLSDAQGFCVATSGGTAQIRGITADQLLKLSIEIAGGSGGGSPQLAQGRLKEPSKFPEILKKIRTYLEEHSK